MSNARHALKELSTGPRVLTLRIHGRASGWFVVEVQDNGAGIVPEALKRNFEFGFTTKKDGHGFGLHSSAILAKELGGHLVGFSDCQGRGAQFALRLPLTIAARISTEKPSGSAAAEGDGASGVAA